jgi:hypothetical protein
VKIPDFAKNINILALTSKLGGETRGRIRVEEIGFNQPWEGKSQSLLLPLFEHAQNLLDHLPVFQADGQKDSLH